MPPLAPPASATPDQVSRFNQLLATQQAAGATLTAAQANLSAAQTAYQAATKALNEYSDYLNGARNLPNIISGPGSVQGPGAA